VLNRVIDWSLRNRFVVIAAALGFAVLGVLAWRRLDVDAFPDTTPVQVQVNTPAPGLAPEEVERQITTPLEQGLGGLPRLQQMRSLSKFGLSQIVIVFEDGTDIYAARQAVTERLAAVELPEGTRRPGLGPVATGLGEVFHYVVAGKRTGLTEVRTLQDWVIKPALRSAPGTAEVSGWGGLEKQYLIRLDPHRLHVFDLTFGQVVQAVRDNNLNVGGGGLAQSGESLLVHGVGRTMTLTQIRDIEILAPRVGAPVRLGDVAEVEEGAELRVGGVTAQGRGEAVLGLGFMLMGENSHAVAGRLRQEFEDVKERLPDGVEARVVYDRTSLVDQVLHTVYRNLFEGGLLVIAVLFLFLGNLRAGILVALAIPLSMLFAFCGMLRFGVAGSLLSLGAIDFGLVVDSSVVMVENAVRRLAHEQKSARTKTEIIRDAAVEVRGPTLFGELIIMIVYLPILTLEGVEGKLFRPMALTVLFALLGSLILSLTLVPALASLLLPRRMREQDSWLVRLLRWMYAPVLRAAMRRRGTVLGAALVALFVGVLAVRSLGSEFVPRLSEGALVINVLRLPGTDLDESLRLNSAMEKVLLAEFPDEVEDVWSRCGTAEVATDPMGPEETDMFVTLKPREKWRKEIHSQEDLVGRMQEALGDMPGQHLSFTQPIEQRVNEMISGARADVAVKLFGDDLNVLAAKGQELADLLRPIPGCEDVSVEQIGGQPELQVRVRQEDLARWGAPARSVLELVEALGGKPVGEVTEGQLRFPLAVRLPEESRRSPEAVGELLVTVPTGDHVPLSRLADVEVVEGPAKVLHEKGQRRITVQCNVRDRDVGSFLAEARRRVAEQFALPSGRYRVEWGGQFENLQRAQTRLMIVAPAALLLILVLLYVTYRRTSDVLLVSVSVPFGLVGGVLALWARGLPFSISAGVGFIALSGVSVLNSMVLVSFIRQLRAKGVPLARAVEGAALTRLRPVLMTALVASLGFLPMALSTGVGAEVQRPLATVMIGGVLTSTLLTLLVLPVLYVTFGPRRAPHVTEKLDAGAAS
jgi:cobalt-zinc-cadmium resistance protein CzcA